MKAPSHVTNHLLLLSLFQSVLQERKWEELERVVGKSVRDEDPEGEDLAEEERSGNHLHNNSIQLVT